jgi:hypothetical protein
MSEKDPALAQFLRLVRHRVGSAGILAQFAGVGQAHLSSMLNGDTSRGAFTWSKVRRVVTSVEWALLEQLPAWKRFTQAFPGTAAQILQGMTIDDPRDPLVLVVCSGCEKALKLIKCVPNMAGRISHGFCPVCYTERMKGMLPLPEIEARLKSYAATDAADPAVIPLRPVEPAELPLFQ